MFALQSIIAFLIVIPIVVFVHEFGHFIVCRWNKVRVESFSIGFGKELFGWYDKHNTRWKISMIPLGGYVQPFGQSDLPKDKKQKALTAEEKKVNYLFKKPWQKISIAAAGPIANFILAIVIFTGIFATLGKPETPPVIGIVKEGSAAAKAGLKENDKVLKINQTDITHFEQIVKIIKLDLEKDITIKVDRNGKEKTFKLVPKVVDGHPEIGIGAKTSLTVQNMERLPIHKAFLEANIQTYSMITSQIKAIGQMIAGERSSKELGGIISIAKFSGEAVEAGAISFLWIIAVISIALGLINLFPIPMLDGGHIVMILIEAILKKPLPEKTQNVMLTIGLCIVITLMVYATWNDITNYIKPFFNS